MDLIVVTPADLRTHWPRISASLDAVQAKAPEDWIKEDVYHGIRSGQAACHIALDDNGFAGLMVTTITRAEFSGAQALHVWIAHNEGEADVIEAGLDLLRAMAHKAGVSRITFGSPRKGWSKKFPLISATYEVPL